MVENVEPKHIFNLAVQSLNLGVVKIIFFCPQSVLVSIELLGTDDYRLLISRENDVGRYTYSWKFLRTKPSRVGFSNSL